jgi:phosphotransferase system  glucose/maltose/N-acetylglucosamine-specific IIC component
LVSVVTGKNTHGCSVRPGQDLAVTALQSAIALCYFSFFAILFMRETEKQKAKKQKKTKNEEQKNESKTRLVKEKNQRLCLGCSVRPGQDLAVTALQSAIALCYFSFFAILFMKKQKKTKNEEQKNESKTRLVKEKNQRQMKCKWT